MSPASAVWFSGNIVGRINNFALRWAGLLLGWVTTILVSNQATQANSARPPSVSRRKEYWQLLQPPLGKKRWVLQRSRPHYQDCCLLMEPAIQPTWVIYWLNWVQPSLAQSALEGMSSHAMDISLYGIFFLFRSSRSIKSAAHHSDSLGQVTSANTSNTILNICHLGSVFVDGEWKRVDEQRQFSWGWLFRLRQTPCWVIPWLCSSHSTIKSIITHRDHQTFYRTYGFKFTYLFYNKLGERI